MNKWRAYNDDGFWRFYKEGIELDWDKSGDVIVDALNAAEKRIAYLEARTFQLESVLITGTNGETE